MYMYLILELNAGGFGVQVFQVQLGYLPLRGIVFLFFHIVLILTVKELLCVCVCVCV